MAKPHTIAPDHVMKTKCSNLVGLFIVIVSCVSVHAYDNPAQAAAREALMQKFADWDRPQTRSAPEVDSLPVTAQPGESEANPKVAVTTDSVTSALEEVSNNAKQPVTAPAKKKHEPAVAKSKPVQAHAPVKLAGATTVAKPVGDDIVTTSGEVYKNAYVEKVESNGLIVSYSIANGGLAMTHIAFADLPEQFRTRYEK